MENEYSIKDLSIGAQLHITPLVSVRPSVILYSNSEKYANVQAGAIVGGHYQPSKHFGVFLDLGLDYIFTSREHMDYDTVGASGTQKRIAAPSSASGFSIALTQNIRSPSSIVSVSVFWI